MRADDEIAASLIVAGGGAVGSCVALMLAQSGVEVCLIDPSGWEDNASAVAGGMLAPAFEAVLDPPMRSRYELLKAAQGLWPAFAERLGPADIGLRKSGGLWIETRSDAEADAVLAGYEKRLLSVGAEARRLSAAEVRELHPGVQAAGAVFTAEDWRLSPMAALKALRAAFRAAGGRLVLGRLIAFEPGVGRLADGRTIRAPRLVLATGAEERDLAPELARLTPIKGQILRYSLAIDPGLPSLHGEGGYITGGAEGVHVGATMETGREDRGLDPAAAARLARFAVQVMPQLAPLRPGVRAGVRAASPDGLPLIGPSARPGVWLALGMRRNGWLLAPLAARMITAWLMDAENLPHWRSMDPDRFRTV